VMRKRLFRLLFYCINIFDVLNCSYGPWWVKNFRRMVA
jgi:hypothetical protein